MRRIDKVAQLYMLAGHKVSIIDGRRLEVVDKETGYIYRVTAAGRPIVGTELLRELAAEKANPNAPKPD